jgi:HAD superfamily hydrolase (TIGR01509 family)
LIHAVVFDFDGLILDTELPVLQSWRQTYEEHGVELPLDTWLETIGTAEHPFDAFDHLESLLGRSLEREPLERKRKLLRDSILHAQDLLPGVRAYLDQAAAGGLKIGIASSSTRRWVMGHLHRLGIDVEWDAVRCADDVERTKPDPEIYLAVLEAMGLPAREAVALEDSHNGVVAAKAAGMWCVAVPSPLTKQMDFSQADLVVESLSQVSLATLIERLSTKD